MSLSRDSRQEKKAKAALRAEFALGQKFDRIDWEEDVLIPFVSELKAGRATFELEAGEVIGVKDETDGAGDSQEN